MFDLSTVINANCNIFDILRAFHLLAPYRFDSILWAYESLFLNYNYLGMLQSQAFIVPLDKVIPFPHSSGKNFLTTQYFEHTNTINAVYHYSIPTLKLSYPEPFIASASFMHSDLWFVHILLYQYWLWFAFCLLIIFFFTTFLCVLRWCQIRTRPRRETRGVSRSKCGDLITAFVPVSWATSIIVNESTDAIDYFDGFGTTEMVFGIRAYQWGWEYYYPKDITLTFENNPTYSSFIGNSIYYNQEFNLRSSRNYAFNAILNEQTDVLKTPLTWLLADLSSWNWDIETEGVNKDPQIEKRSTPSLLNFDKVLYTPTRENNLFNIATLPFFFNYGINELQSSFYLNPIYNILDQETTSFTPHTSLKLKNNFFSFNRNSLFFSNKNLEKTWTQLYYTYFTLFEKEETLIKKERILEIIKDWKLFNTYKNTTINFKDNTFNYLNFTSSINKLSFFKNKAMAPIFFNDRNFSLPFPFLSNQDNFIEEEIWDILSDDFIPETNLTFYWGKLSHNLFLKFWFKKNFNTLTNSNFLLFGPLTQFANYDFINKQELVLLENLIWNFKTNESNLNDLYYSKKFFLKKRKVKRWIRDEKFDAENEILWWLRAEQTGIVKDELERQEKMQYLRFKKWIPRVSLANDPSKFLYSMLPLTNSNFHGNQIFSNNLIPTFLNLSEIALEDFDNSLINFYLTSLDKNESYINSNYPVLFQTSVNVIDTFLSNYFDTNRANSTQLPLNWDIFWNLDKNQDRFIKIQTAIKAYLVAINSYMKVSKGRIDELRAHANTLDLNLSWQRIPIMQDLKWPTQKFYYKNWYNIIKTSPLSWLPNNFLFNETIKSAHFSLNLTPFWIGELSDFAKHIWFDWYSKWGKTEVQMSSIAKFAIFGLFYPSKILDFTPVTNQYLLETETYFSRIARARRNYINSYIPNLWLYMKANSLFFKSSTFDLISNEKFIFFENKINLLWNHKIKIEKYILYSNILDSFVNAPLSSSYTRTNSNFFNAKTPSATTTEILNCWSRYSYLISTFYNNHPNKSSKNFINSYLDFNFLFKILKINNLAFSNTYTFFDNSDILLKNQYKPMRKGITNLIRLHANGAIVVPAEIRLQILASSKDVIHSWAIPSAGIKIDCIPGYSSHKVFLFFLFGIFWGQCMEVCGRYHHWMPIVVFFTKIDFFFLWCTHFVFPKENSKNIHILSKNNINNNNTSVTYPLSIWT